jgi:glycosyltransferase involved in cell wall biosynthesis
MEDRAGDDMSKIIIWLGPAVEKWDPATALATGIGGSETAAIHMSRELALLGHEVVVYADVSRFCSIDADDSGKFLHSCDVEWVSYGELPPREPCDLFISSRQPDARRHLRPLCRRAWLWVHDLHCGPDWENVIATDYDKILCLSSWARTKFLEYYPGVEPTKVVQTRNTADPELFASRAGSAEASDGLGKTLVTLHPGDQHMRWAFGTAPFRVTYSSSPDRGLDKLLDLWPVICEIASIPRNHHPPELHVYYGFETWEKMATLQGSDSELVKLVLLREKMERTPGVHYHGRAGQAEIARSHLQSQLWLYPTDFLETSCITAMEAQAAGCKVIATRCGALPETVSSGYLVDGPTSREGYVERFLECVREALADDSCLVVTPRPWAEVAKQWDAWLKET